MVQVGVRRRLGWMMGLLVMMAVAVAGVLWLVYGRSYVFLGGQRYDRYARELDLRGCREVEFHRLSRFYALERVDLRDTDLQPEQYDVLRSSLPECEILWQVPFQDGYVDVDAKKLTVTSFSVRDLAATAYLPELETLDATGCRDYGTLAALSLRRPDCKVIYQVPLGGILQDAEADTLELPELDMEELREKLPYLPRAKKLLTETIPTPAALEEIERRFPEVTVFYILGNRRLPLGSGYKEADLRGARLSCADLAALIRCWPDLTMGDIRNCGLSEREQMALCDAFPNCFLRWEVPFGDVFYPSDAQELDLSGLTLPDTAWLENKLRYMPNVRRVILEDCGLADEALAMLNDRLENTRIVWTVHIGQVAVRTDAEFFAPVVTGQFVTEADMAPLKYCTDLVAIDLGHMSVRSCTWAEYMPNLRYLILADTCVTDISPLRNCGELVFLELFLTGVRDYSPLLSCRKLEDLNLCYCPGKSAPVKKMTWLKRLWWDGNPYETRGLENYLPDTECNFTSRSSTGGSWRLGERYKQQRDILGMGYMVG